MHPVLYQLLLPDACLLNLQLGALGGSGGGLAARLIIRSPVGRPLAGGRTTDYEPCAGLWVFDIVSQLCG